MERVLDLDEVASEVTNRSARWTSAGLIVGELTWRDPGEWPWRIVADRRSVIDPDSVGVCLTSANGDGTEVQIVFFIGGWADVTANISGDLVIDAPDVPSAAGAGLLLDGLVNRAFGVRE